MMPLYEVKLGTRKKDADMFKDILEVIRNDYVDNFQDNGRFVWKDDHRFGCLHSMIGMEISKKKMKDHNGRKRDHYVFTVYSNNGSYKEPYFHEFLRKVDDAKYSLENIARTN